MILIPKNFSPTGIGSATKNGHIVLLLIDEKNTSDEDIHLTRLNRIERESALNLLGIPESEISGIYHSTKGYLEPLLRNPKLEPIDYSIPTWLSSYPEEVLLAALFATEWTENNKEDCQLLETLSGIPYQEFQKSLISLSRENDPPVRQIGDTWQVIAKVDFWLLISPLLSKPSLDRLEQAARDAICDLDPAFELPINERHLASIKGKKPKYSGLVKLGISDSLALLSAYGDDRSQQLGGLKPSQVVKGCIKDIFKNNETPEFWYSLGRKMQLLAEASPQEFLQAVETAAQGDSNIIQRLFEESEDPLMSSCQHSELLWSIELISWNKELLSSSSLILCRLCEIDPGGSWSNRPFNSLTTMYLGWINNCTASHSERAQIIEMVLFREYPEIAWDLCISLLYSNTISSTGLSKPEYRDWSSNVEKSTLQSDYISYVNKLSDILIENSESNQIKNILDLIKNFESFDEDQRKRVLEKLGNITADSLKEENRKKLLDKIRDIVSRHREFPDADWAWSEDILSPLSDTYTRLDFTEPEKSNLYLFTNGYPDLITPPTRKELDIKERDKLIRNTRITAISETYQKSGIEGIKYLTINCLSPSILGRCAYESSVSEELLEHALAWITDTENLGIFAREYIYSLANFELSQALEVYYEQEGSWDSEKKAHYLRALPICEDVLKIVEGSPEDCREIYWTNLYYFFTPDDPSLVQRVARKLSDYKRHLSAIDCAARLFHRKTSADLIDAQLIYEILIKIATEETSSERITIQNVRHDILEAIKFIQDYGNDSVLDICYLEWAYLKLFRFENVTPNFLIAKISEEPEFFAQLVSWIFKNSAGKIDNQDGLSEEAHRQRAELAWELLDTADNLPGQKGDTIDADHLLTWVTQARATLNKLDRLGIGDDRIGSYLSRGPAGSDGVWPHEAVRNVIEKIKSSDLDEAIGIGRLNTRGVTWRHPYAGGEQERKLAKKYQADAEKLQLIYPRSARILFDLANHYESDAARQDQEVQINE